MTAPTAAARFFGRGREDFSPIRATHIAAAGPGRFLLRLKLWSRRFRQPAERFLLFAVDIDHHHRHRAARQRHRFTHRLDGLGEKLVRETEVIQYITHHRGIKFVGG